MLIGPYQLCFCGFTLSKIRFSSLSFIMTRKCPNKQLSYQIQFIADVIQYHVDNIAYFSFIHIL